MYERWQSTNDSEGRHAHRTRRQIDFQPKGHCWLFDGVHLFNYSIDFNSSAFVPKYEIFSILMLFRQYIDSSESDARARTTYTMRCIEHGIDDIVTKANTENVDVSRSEVKKRTRLGPSVRTNRLYYYWKILRMRQCFCEWWLAVLGEVNEYGQIDETRWQNNAAKDIEIAFKGVERRQLSQKL